MDFAGVRAFALSLPEAREQSHRGRPAWRVESRIFAWATEEPDVVTLKLDRDDQLAFLEAEPDAVKPGKWYSQHGWTRLHLGRAGEGLARSLIQLAWVNVAPKRLSRSEVLKGVEEG